MGGSANELELEAACLRPSDKHLIAPSGDTVIRLSLGKCAAQLNTPPEPGDTLLNTPLGDSPVNTLALPGEAYLKKSPRNATAGSTGYSTKI